MTARVVENARFVSLISPPPGHDAAAAIERMRPCLGAAAGGVANRFGIPPCIVAVTPDAKAAEDAVNLITSLGGDAFAPSSADILALGPTLKVKHLERSDNGSLHADLWRGGSITFEPASIQILVRASLGKRPAGFGTPDADHLAQIGATGALVLDVALGGDGLGYAGRLGPSPPPPLRPTNIPSEKLDVHLATGQVLQIDGDKFGFQILGVLRRQSDKANIDEMIELFRHLADHLILDTYFPTFKPPKDVDRIRLPNARLNNDHPIFAFYSRWAALMYRHVAASR
ncbi:MAG: hypothetical protein JNK58_08680 [Phycisphaerae bacterium]|nr:hypothetical protein [Phycisphaerae bacterium]